MYTADEHDLVGGGGVRTLSREDAKAYAAEQRAKKAAQAPAGKDKTADKFSAGAGTPLGRSFKKFLG